MSRRRALWFVAAGAAVVTYLLLAPFRCMGGAGFLSLPTRVCKGFVAFEYGDARPFLAPQAVITALVVGALTALVVWLFVRRPVAPALVRGLVGAALVAVTVMAALSLGGAIVYAAPVLLPGYWWMASQSGLIGRILWSLLATLAAFGAWMLLSYMVSPHPPWAIVAFLLGLAAGAAVFLAPKGKQPDLWSRP